MTGNLGIGANVGLLKAVFKSFPGGTSTGLDAAGKRLPDAPSLTAAVTTDYGMQTPGGRFDFYGEYSFRRKSYTGADNDETLERLDSRDIVNARLTFTPDNSRWGLSVWARNLFDNDYTTTRGRDFFGNQFIKRGDPRAFGAEARYNF